MIHPLVCSRCGSMCEMPAELPLPGYGLYFLLCVDCQELRTAQPDLFREWLRRAREECE